MSSIQFYTKGEEITNSVTHAAGIGLGVAAGWFLVVAAIQTGNLWAVSSISIYLMGMLFSYTTSTCYHACTNTRRKDIWRKLDHSAIYMHIAGTYAPFTLLVLRETGGWGWILFCGNWLMAFMGLYMSFRKLKEHSHLETICFILMGCSILLAFRPLINELNVNGQIETLYWLIAGGVAYIIGAIFYSLTQLRYMHSIFHLLVLVGSICHIQAIFLIL